MLSIKEETVYKLDFEETVKHYPTYRWYDFLSPDQMTN